MEKKKELHGKGFLLQEEIPNCLSVIPLSLSYLFVSHFFCYIVIKLRGLMKNDRLSHREDLCAFKRYYTQTPVSTSPLTPPFTSWDKFRLDAPSTLVVGA